MKKGLKILGKVLLAFIIVLALALLVIYVYNRIKMKQEQTYDRHPAAKTETA